MVGSLAAYHTVNRKICATLTPPSAVSPAIAWLGLMERRQRSFSVPDTKAQGRQHYSRPRRRSVRRRAASASSREYGRCEVGRRAFPFAYTQGRDASSF
jgi:hypothetical protein